MEERSEELWHEKARQLGIVVIIPTYNNEKTLTTVIEDVLFYVECKSDTTNISKATRFSLDEAMKRAKFLNCGTCHYSCVRIPA